MRALEAWDTLVGWLAILLSTRVGADLTLGEFVRPAFQAGWRLVPPKEVDP